MLRSKECSAIMRCKIVLVSVLLQVTFGFEISDDDTHQGIVQLARIERPGYWTFIEDKSQTEGGVLPYSRLGRKVFKLPQTLIPYPRTGRMLVDSEVFDYDILPEYPWTRNLADSTLADIFLDSKPLGAKRASIAFPPRIGRKKRSISEGTQLGRNDRGSAKNQDESLENPTDQDWSDLEEYEPDFFFRADRRPSSRSRNAFVPRVGKKRSDDSIEEDSMMEAKRALAFQPRVGRDSFISRMSRNDQRGLFQVKSRGAFVPRIGRRSSFIPRIGRDVRNNSKE